MAWPAPRCTLALLAATALLGSATATRAATLTYADGDAINLVTGRNNTYSASGGPLQNLTGPIRLAYAPNRFDAANSVDGAYWQVNFPTAYSVSNVSVQTHPAPYRMLTMNVQTTTDGLTWSTQSTASVGAGDLLSTSFAPVSGVTGVRLVGTSSENAGFPAIFYQIRVTGPNDALPLFHNGNSEFSINSAIWNGGTVQSAAGWNPYSGGGSTIAPIDDASIEPYTYNKIIYATGAADPAPIDILLDKNYTIDSVGISTGTETSGRTATHVDISYSSDVTGAFTPILTNVPLLGNYDSYYEIDLGGIFDARRIRYDFSHPNSSAGETFISELYAFAVEVPPPAPEPGSATIFAVGLAMFAMKRRRKAATVA